MHGKMCIDYPCSSIIGLSQALMRADRVTDIATVIIDPADPVFANDVLNWVDCEVVTLDVIIEDDGQTAYFAPYNPEDYDV